MDSRLHRCIETFADLKVLVIGETILDSYLEGTAERLCREAPVPVVSLAGRTDAPGGAGNTAVNIHSLSSQVFFLSVTGDDLEGDFVKRALEERGVSTGHILACEGRRTLAKHRVVADSQVLVRFDQGSTEAVDPETERALISRLSDLFPICDAVIVSDYGYGILTPNVIDALARLQSRNPRVLVVDSKYLRSYSHIGVTAVKPNHDEVVKLLGTSAAAGAQARAEWIALEGERLLDITGAQIVAVTLDTEGSIILERGNPPYRTYARPMPHARAVGAGDTFVSTMALSLAARAATPMAAELASAAAHVVVSKEGTAACSADELYEHFTETDKYVPDLDRLASRVEFYRRQGRRIVFTNGCFDILHRGHIAFLNRAKALGDLLVVGVNTDAGVRRLKGPGRPINTLEDRVQVLAALSCVDHIVPFTEDTPEDLIDAIRPDVFAKGGNYTRARLPEVALVERLGGKVRILPYLDQGSATTTTAIIEKIRAAYSNDDQDGSTLLDVQAGAPDDAWGAA